MSRFLLDTNHMSAAIRRTSPLRERVRSARFLGHAFGVVIPVLCELEIGIEQTADPEGNRRRLRQFSSHLRTWPLEAALVHHYATIYAELRERGRVLSQVDMFLASLCRQMNLILLTSDRDFEALPELRTENWLIESAAE